MTALEGTVIDGKWKLATTTARVGYYLALGDLASTMRRIGTASPESQMKVEDEGGQTFTFAQIAIGDVIRIGATGSSAIFKCTSTFTQYNGDVYNATVELLKAR